MTRLSSRRTRLSAALWLAATFAIGSALTRLGSPNAMAADGAFSWQAIGSGNQDANVGLSTSKTYFNAVNTQGGGLTINGVPFEGSSGGNPSGTNYSISGATNTLDSGGTNNVTGQLGALLNGFVYNGNPSSFTLNGLTSGQTYALAFYNRSWSGNRTQNITTTSGATTAFDQDFNTVGDLNILRYTFTASGASETLTFTPTVPAATFHFYGFSTEQVFNNSWTSGSDWTTATWITGTTPAPVPNGVGTNADFTAQSSPTTITVDAPVTTGNVRFAGSNAWTVAGPSTLTLQAEVAGVAVLAASSGTHTISAPVALASSLFKTGAGAVEVSGAVSGSGGVTVGAGTLTFSGNNTYSGTTTVSSGTLQIGSSGTSGSLGSGAVVNDGRLLFDRSDVATVSNVISGAGGITKLGAGTLTLAGNNTYSGGTTIRAGTLQLNSTSALGNGGLGIENGSTLALRSDTDATFAGGNGLGGLGGASITIDVNQLTTGNTGKTLSFAPAGFNTYQTTINVTGGNGYTLALGGINEGFNGPLTLNAASANLTIGGIGSSSAVSSLSVSGAASTTISGAIATNGNVTKSGGGTLFLSGVSGYSTVTVFEGGIVNAATFADYGSNSSLGNRAASADAGGNVGLLFRGGTLQYTGSTAQSTDRGIRLSTAGGGGTIDASGSDPAATLSFTAASSPNLFEEPGNRTLSFAGSNTGANTFAMAIAEAGGTTTVVKTGAGRWMLTGTSSYSGVTVFSGGTLNAATIANNGTASSLGVGTGDTDPANIGLLFRGGTLQYTGSTAQSTDRAIRLSTDGGGGTIDASGSTPEATLSFTRSSMPNWWENGGTRTFTLKGSNTGANTLAAGINDLPGQTTMNVRKEGVGTWVLSGSGSYLGVTEITAGTLVAANNNALGAGGFDGSTMTNIRDGATLALQGGVTINEHFHVWGTGVGGLGAVRSLSGNNALISQGYALRSNVTVGVDADTLSVSRFYEEGGNYGLTKVGAGTLTLTGPSDYTGGTTINAGTAMLSYEPSGISNTAIGPMTSGNSVTINNGGTLTGSVNNWLSNTGLASGGSNAISVVVNQGGTLRGANGSITGLGNVTLNGGTIEVTNGLGLFGWDASFTLGGDITVSGSTASSITTAAGAGATATMYMSNGANGTGGTRTFTVNDVTGNAASDLVVSARLSNGTVVKAGAGTLELADGSTGTGTPVNWQVNDGRLAVNTAISSTVSVASGATLGGSGSIAGPVNVLGTLSPGNSPGVITLGSLVLGGTSTTLIEIEGTSRGTQYDGVDITGLDGLTYGGLLSLDFSLLGSPVGNGTVFDIFNFSGTPSGSFSSVVSIGTLYSGTWTSVGAGAYELVSGGQTLTFSPASGNILVVPEPAGLAVFGLGLAAGVAIYRRRRA